MTEYEKGCIALRACGYTNRHNTRLWTHPSFDGERYLGNDDELWSSVDNAIAHAEAGGFAWEVGRNAHESVVLPERKYVARIGEDKDGRVYWYSTWGYAGFPGLAIRNAIVAWADNQKGGG